MNDDLAELTARFGAPAERDLPPGRHAMHREYLMSQIVSPPTRTPAPRARARRLIAVTAVAAAAAAVAFVAVWVHPGGGAAPVASRPAPYVPVQAGSAAAVRVYLDRIAQAAAAAPAAKVGPGQWFYLKTEAEYAEETGQQTFDGPWKMGPLTVRESWIGQRASQATMYRQNGRDTPVYPAAGAKTGIDAPSYAWAQSLPADPARLLQVVYAEMAGDGSVAANGRHFAAFEAVGGLLDSAILPPQTEAAFFRATALIPGVVFVPDSTDAAGRHGLGIAMTDATGERYEWIFSKSTYQYLGERDYQVRTTSNAKAGTLVGLSAVLARGDADSAGGTPHLIP